MRGRVNAIRTFKGLVADLRINKFIVNVSYNVGLTNVYDNYNYKNSFLQLTLGYKIHI